MAEAQPFWRAKTLAQMSRDEWESLCDGCGKCCVHKIEDAVTGEVSYTAVACRLLDLETVRCTNYPLRKAMVPSCASLTPEQVEDFHWLPRTCAYRMVSEGQDLPDWHHLKSGSRATIHEVGASVQGRVISERVAGPAEDYVVEWPDL